MNDDTNDADDFEHAVVEYLRERGHDDAAAWTRENSRDMSGLGPADVAREEGIEPTADPTDAQVAQVADAILGGFGDWLSGFDADEQAEIRAELADAAGEGDA